MDAIQSLRGKIARSIIHFHSFIIPDLRFFTRVSWGNEYSCFDYSE